MGYLTMSYKELEQAKVFEQVKQRVITQAEAAARLRISERWVRIKFKRFRLFKEAGLVHKNRGKVSPRRWDIAQEQLLIELLQGDWHDFGPTFAAEKLAELHNIKISREVVRQAMIRANLWQPKLKRNEHRKRRDRKAMLGMMVQLDGSPHDWFEGRAGKCTLLVFIDDATSQILWLEFAKSESVAALMQATKNYVQKHGVPQLFYTDHGSVFHVNLNNVDNLKKTQWERACAQLGIKVQHAHSPQAKGRVERCNNTMQDRLSKELRLAGISSINDANEYLRNSDFIARHNAKFAVTAAQSGNAHADRQVCNLDDIFSIHETRVLANDFTITYQKHIFQLHKEQKTIIHPKNEITVKTRLDGTIRLWIRKTELFYHEIYARPVQVVAPKFVAYASPYKPSNNSQRWVSGLPPMMSRDEAGLAGHRGILNLTK